MSGNKRREDRKWLLTCSVETSGDGVEEGVLRGQKALSAGHLVVLLLLCAQSISTSTF